MRLFLGVLDRAVFLVTLAAALGVALALAGVVDREGVLARDLVGVFAGVFLGVAAAFLAGVRARDLVGVLPPVTGLYLSPDMDFLEEKINGRVER